MKLTMRINGILLAGSACLLLSCGNPGPAQVENVTEILAVGDEGLVVKGIQITVANPASLKQLKAEDFDLVNNVPQGFVEPVTGGELQEYEDDGIVLSRSKGTLTIGAKPFNQAGKSEGWFKHIPWELRCSADSALNVTPDKLTGRKIEILDDCIQGSFSFAGLTREYMLYLPKDEKGNPIPNVPLLVWQIGGGEYDRDLMTVATANRCLVSLPTEGIPCATLVFAIANPNYSYSASLCPPDGLYRPADRRGQSGRKQALLRRCLQRRRLHPALHDAVPGAFQGRYPLLRHGSHRAHPPGAGEV